MKNIYNNDILGFSVEIPRGYRLGESYMTYLNEVSADSIRISGTSTYSTEKSEVVVLTTQDKSKEQQGVEILEQNPNLNLEQVCECIVLKPNLMPKPMADLVNERDIKDGMGTQNGVVNLKNGETEPVYEWDLSTYNPITGVKIGNETQSVTNVYFNTAQDYTHKNQYSDDQTITAFGLTISRYLKDSQTASLQDIVDAIKLQN